MSAGEIYSPGVKSLLALGAGRSHSSARFTPDHLAWPNYVVTCGLGESDVGQLMAVLSDVDLDHGEGKLCWARVHAYRALGQLKAGAAGKALVAAFHTAIRQKDARARQELPAAMEMMGAGFCEDAIVALEDRSLDSYVHVVMASILAAIGQSTPKLRARCIQALMGALECGPENDPRFNSGLILSLKLLNASAADELIQHVCRNGWADERMLQYALQDSGPAKAPR